VFLAAFSNLPQADLNPVSIIKTRSASELFVLPLLQYEERLGIQRNMAGLAGLGRVAANGEELLDEVGLGPGEAQQLAAAQSGVHRQQYRLRQVVGEMSQLGEGRVAALGPP